MEQIIIVGAGGFGSEVAMLIEDINAVEMKWDLIGFVDDSASGYVLNKYPILGGVDYLQDKECSVVLALGNPETKEKILKNIINTKIKYPNLIHPSVIYNPNYISMGEGNIICAGNIITTNITIGSHVIINLDCTIGHDAIVRDFVTILPSVNVSGNVTLEKCSNIGTGTQIIQGLTIGENTIVGAGAVVTKNLESFVVAVGSPARPIKKRG